MACQAGGQEAPVVPSSVPLARRNARAGRVFNAVTSLGFSVAVP